MEMEGGGGANLICMYDRMYAKGRGGAAEGGDQSKKRSPLSCTLGSPASQEPRAWLGRHRVEGHSTDAEWLAKLLVYDTLRDWLGRLYVPSDSTGALACKATRGPKPGTVMSVLYRQCAFSPVARGVFEVWLRAQLDTEEKDQLVLLNKEADRLADLGAACAVLYTIPLLALLKGRVLGHVAGKVLLTPASGVERVYMDNREQAYRRRFPGADEKWNAREYVELIHEAEVGDCGVQTAMQLRVLTTQTQPEGLSRLVCRWCQVVSPRLGYHVWYECTKVHLVLLRMAWLWFRSLGKEGCWAPSELGLLVDGGGTKWGVVLDDHREKDTESAVLMSVSGRWMVTLAVKQPGYVNKQTRLKLTREAVKSLSSPAGLQEVMDMAPVVGRLVELERVQRTLMGRADVTLSEDLGPPMTVPHSVLLGVVLRGLQNWRLSLAGTPGLVPPQQGPERGVPEVQVVCLLG